MAPKTNDQIKIEYEPEQQTFKVFSCFKEVNFTNCKINTFPYNIEHILDFEIKNKTAASFIMIDLNLNDLGEKESLGKQLNKTLEKLSLKFKREEHTTVLWTDNGYYVYQSIDGAVFKKYLVFYIFLPYLDGRDLTTEFKIC